MTVTFHCRFGLAALRASWRLWVGVFLLVAVVAAATVACSIVVRSAGAQPETQETKVVLSMIGFNIASVSVVGALMLRGLVMQVTGQLRREMARWMLVGLLPGQVGRIVALQILAVSVLGVVGGAPVGIGVAAFLIHLVLGSSSVVPLQLDTPGFLVPVAVVLGCIVLFMRGPWRTSTRVDPASAVRDRPSVDRARARRVRNAVAGLIVVGVAVGLWWAARSGQVDIAAGALFGETLSIVLVVALLGPSVLVGIHSAWTGLIMFVLRRFPGGSSAWWLARAVTGHDRQRVTAVAVPVAIVTLLPGGISLIANSLRASQLASAGVTQASGASARELLALCAMPSLIALAGGALALFMSGARRDRELALTALVGATPAQQIRQACFEAVSLTATGIFVGVAGLLAVSATALAVLGRLFDHVVVDIPVALVLLCAATTAVLTSAASITPALVMVTRPPHRAHAGIE